MSHQIIKQPNGRYSIWSTVVDHFVFVDGTPEEMIEYYCQKEREGIKRSVNERVKELESGATPYGQFTMDWDEAVEEAISCHGEDDNVIRLMRKENIIEEK